MFTVNYTFRVRPGMEEIFQRSWALITKEYLRTRGSLGSRLKKDQSGTFVAIALWPDREHWESQWRADPLKLPRDHMQKACDEIRVVHEMEMAQDLWVHMGT